MFDQMIAQIIIDKASNIMVSEADWKIFCKEYIFEKLKGETLGSAFCKRFEIENWLISNMIDDNYTRLHIEKFYIK
jgi:hypothetical protein